MVSEAREEVAEAQDETSEGGANQPAEQSSGNGSTLRRAAAGGALVAAAGTTAYLARRAMRNHNENGGAKSEKPASKSDEGQRSGNGAAGTSGGWFEDFFTVLRTRGWDTANDMLVPIAENAAHKAGTLAAEKSPDLVRDSLLPKFVEGFTEAREAEKG